MVETGLFVAQISLPVSVQWLDLAFSSFYMLEMISRIIFFGLIPFTRVAFNDFDCVVVVVNFALDIALFNFTSIDAQRVQISVRLLRFLRLIYYINYYRIIIVAVIELSVMFARIAGIIAAVYILFAFIGMQAYGGRLYIGQSLLIGSVYDSSNYYVSLFPISFCNKNAQNLPSVTITTTLAMHSLFSFNSTSSTTGTVFDFLHS